MKKKAGIYIKVFSGFPAEIEQSFENWYFDKMQKPKILMMAQSESQGGEGFGITLSMLYKWGTNQ